MTAILFEGLFHRDSINNLDVPDLWLDLRGIGRKPRARRGTGHALALGAFELDLPRVWRAQGRFRDGADLKFGERAQPCPTTEIRAPC